MTVVMKIWMGKNIQWVARLKWAFFQLDNAFCDNKTKTTNDDLTI